MCTTTIITRPNRVKELIMQYIIDKSDGKTENHPYFQDLVSSLSVFNNQKKTDIELEEGDLVILDNKTYEEIDIEMIDKLLYTASIGVSNGKYACKINNVIIGGK